MRRRPSAGCRRCATLHEAGIPVGVLVAPVIPQLNDKDLEAVPRGRRRARRDERGLDLLRLPLEVAPLFRAWLDEHFPLRAAHVMSLVQQMRGGRDYQSAFGTRMRGTGTFADLIERRFDLAVRRLKLDQGRSEAFDTSRFRPPGRNEAQGELF